MTVTIRFPPHCAFTIPEAHRGLLAVVLVLYQASTRVVLEVLQLTLEYKHICTKTCAFVCATHPSPITSHHACWCRCWCWCSQNYTGSPSFSCDMPPRIVPAAAHVSAISRGCHLPVATHIIPEYCQYNHLSCMITCIRRGD